MTTKTTTRVPWLLFTIFVLLAILPSCWVWILIDSNSPHYSRHWSISTKRMSGKEFKVCKRKLHLANDHTVKTNGIYVSIYYDKSPKNFIFYRFFESGHYILGFYECEKNCPPLDSLREKYVYTAKYGYYSTLEEGKILTEFHDNKLGTEQQVFVSEVKGDTLKSIYSLDIKNYSDIIKKHSPKKQQVSHFVPIKLEPNYTPNW